MKQNNLFLKNNIQKNYLKASYQKKLNKEFNKTLIKLEKDTEDTKKTVNVLSNNFKFNFKIKDLKKFKKYKTIAIMGMGGSILGAEAIYNFLEKKIKKNIIFFDNLDEEKLKEFRKRNNFENVLFFIISKSGDTIETLANLLILNVIKKNKKNIIIITEKNNNTLHSISKKYNLFCIEHKKYIGGRFSVLSEVGLVPAYLMGLDIFNLRLRVLDFFKGKDKSILRKSAIALSGLLNSKKINNLVFINYSPKLEKFLFWCQQLIAESLGKKGNGFLPLVSSAPKDHHSLLQLYLDGPKDKLFYIFSSNEISKEKINSKKITNSCNFINKKNLSTLKKSQKSALLKAFKKNKIPFREFRINRIKEDVLGKLFSYFIIETILIGNLIKVDPFNQPAVEQVKKFTKNFLAKSTKNYF